MGNVLVVEQGKVRDSKPKWPPLDAHKALAGVVEEALAEYERLHPPEYRKRESFVPVPGNPHLAAVSLLSA